MSPRWPVVSLLVVLVALGVILGPFGCTRAEPVELGSRPEPRIDQQVPPDLQTATFASG